MAYSPLLPFSFAKQHRLLFDETEQGLVLCAYTRPAIPVLAEIQRGLGSFDIRIEPKSLIENAIQQTYETSSAANLDQFEGAEDESLDAIAMDLHEPADLLDSDDEAPVIRMLNALIAQAILDKASDIHIESYENRLRIRFRVDGNLKQVLEPSPRIAPLLVSRIKVMAKLDISEKRLPQDGRIAIKLGGRSVDLRVSTLPSGRGEKVVLRVLDKQAGRLQLSQIGMQASIYEPLQKIIQKPHGILLVTGPTGSGKTTTLYAALTELNTQERNISTVEDPIEYYIDGINQTHINTKVDMTFAKGLKALLRQDPDIIMVGEIRDTETAQTTVQASLTGHLVISTLHTNTAVGAIARLRDMGVEPFLLASSLSGVLAQRLVRVLCPSCKTEHLTEAKEQQVLNIDQAHTIYQAHGCEQCNFTGYKGRTGLYELITIDEQLKRLIHNEASETELAAAVKDSLISLSDQAKAAVLNGHTSLDEAIRVVSL